ncbi:hypothetical protein [Microvirga tunisiensis]|uniref:VOC family protein n=1 Tax=Microvirga tunisiensis TaxID=2108360 RepID=A0A5N7MA17_9HYPH|nr:hypothetical protein [Microvirga tunisiensis]MPR05543.1 hypothetical protein [Microvirga tunisiensis]MPR23743.1 hypothetical protein [Microvirga tunisiensis]
MKKEYEFESRHSGRVHLAASRLAVEACSRPSPANELEAKFSLKVVSGSEMRSGACGPIRSIYCRDPDGSLIEIASYELIILSQKS